MQYVYTRMRRHIAFLDVHVSQLEDAYAACIYAYAAGIYASGLDAHHSQPEARALAVCSRYIHSLRAKKKKIFTNLGAMPESRACLMSWTACDVVLQVLSMTL